jgi:uncharacterized membrane protein YkvI
VAATYIGTIVGAGFASGQEILQFFTRFGALGLVGLVFCAVMFAVFGYIIMRLGKELNARSHMEIIRYSGGKVLGRLVDFIITFFLFGALTAMIAGTGALFEQEFHLPELLGNLLMAVLTALTVLTGINGVINSISFVVPFLLLAVVGTSMFSIATAPPDLTASVSAIGESGLISNWFLAAVLYVSYNTIISIAVLGPLGVKAKNSKIIKRGAILGGVGLGIGSIMIYLSLAGNLESVSGLEVPMIYIASGISPLMQLIYAIVLIAEIYTTAVGSLYGFASRISEIAKDNGKGIIVIATLISLVASRFGFSNLVKYLYPVVGYGGMILLISLLYIEFKHKRLSRSGS